jgi:hypothetical protein
MPKIAVITDLHWPERIARNGHIRHGDCSLSVVDEFNRAAAKAGAELAVQLGDAVTAFGCGSEKFKEIHSRLNRFPGPVHHIPGNNEDRYYRRSFWSRASGSPEISTSEDFDGLHMIFFRPSAKVKNLKLPDISCDLDWLANDLDKTDLPSVIFSHVPLFRPTVDLCHNPDFPPPDTLLYYPGEDKIREIIDTHMNVAGLVSGHLHRDILEVSRKGYFCMCVQAATQGSSKSTEPDRSFGILDIDTNKKLVTIIRSGSRECTTTMPLRGPEAVL